MSRAARTLLVLVLIASAVPPATLSAQERGGLRERIESRFDKWRRGPLVRQLRAELVKARQERRYYRGETDRLNRELAEERAKPRAECPAPVPLPPPRPPIGSKG